MSMQTDSKDGFIYLTGLWLKEEKQNGDRMFTGSTTVERLQEAIAEANADGKVACQIWLNVEKRKEGSPDMGLKMYKPGQKQQDNGAPVQNVTVAATQAVVNDDDDIPF
jgi:hypothetical protein